MIRSLKVSNGSFAALGGLQIQPVTSDTSTDVKRQVTTPGTLTSPGTPPAHEAVISTPVLSGINADVKVSHASLSDITKSLINDKNFVLPSLHTKFNQILPSFAQHLEPLRLLFPISDQLVVNSKKFAPYEQLTGISQERPELVMLTNFQPLFTKDVHHSAPPFLQLIENGGVYPFMTDAGRYIDNHLQTHTLRVVDIIQLVREIRFRWAGINATIAARKTALQTGIDALQDTSNFLLELVRSLEQLKGQFDVRSDLHEVEPARVVTAFAHNFSRLEATTTSNVLMDFARRYLPPTYTPSDSLVKLGYDAKTVRELFSSTKVWMQLTFELEQLLQYHSLQFIDIDPVSQRRDRNASTITRTSARHFTLNRNLANLPPLAEFSAIKPAQVTTAVNTVNQTWRVLYESVHFKTPEAHIDALVNLVSKEFRYSYGLSAPEVQDALLKEYGYPVTPADNPDVFASIVGKFGNNISDFPVTQTNSVANIAQRQPDQSMGVLTFESKYVEGDTGTLTPGGAYYVDTALETNGQAFNTGNLEELAGLLEGAYRAFSVVTNGMNLLATRIYDPYNRIHSQFSTIVSSPVSFVQQTLENLVDLRSGATLPVMVNDNLGAVYSYAAHDSRVKSALFLYTMARITRVYNESVPFFGFEGLGTAPVDNTPLTDALVTSVLDNLAQATPETLTGNQFITNKFFHLNKESSTLAQDTIKAALQAGTVLTRFVESTMQQVLSAFRFGDKAMIDDHTRFNGYLDTVVMMTAFDAILQMIARYNNQRIVSATHGLTNYTQGTRTYTIARTTVNHRASIQDLVTRMEKEVGLTHDLIYAVLNSLQKLSGACRNQVNYLKSPQATGKLRELANVIDNPVMLRMLMSEQQIMLLASTVHDLVARTSQPGAVPDSGDANKDGNFDSDDEIKVLDDSEVSPKLRNALYGLFGSDQYAAKKGYNKKVLTVGIPLGFADKMKQRVKLGRLKKSSFADKQNDIVNVVVYKIDMQNSDIVYKPQRFLFELSRFPVRNDNLFLPLGDNPTLDKIVSSIPTRDYGVTNARNNQLPKYWPESPSDNDGIAFDETYSFLTLPDKNDIIKNHVLSYLYEVYVKLMTGVSLADYHFDLVDPPKPVEANFIKTLVEHHVALNADLFKVQQVTPVEYHPAQGGVLFSSTVQRNPGFVSHPAVVSTSRSVPRLANASGQAGNISHASALAALPQPVITKTLEQQRAIGSLDANLANISYRNVPVVLHGMRTISAMANMLTSIADPLSVSKRIVSPKQFDRIFNVMIDPDEFQIDYAKTVATPQGQQALHHLIEEGEIIPETENFFFRNLTSVFRIGDLHNNPTGRPYIQNRITPDIALYRYRDRDRNQGDLSFEKYFVTVESYGEEEV